jgi:uncharacterized protein
MFLDGRRGSTADPDALVTCVDGAVLVKGDLGRSTRWPAMSMSETATSFSSVQTRLAGRLIEPAGAADERRPLVVMVHGSEQTSAFVNLYAYVLAARNIAVFVYDKRGVGASEGYYTQNFELLAADAAAALTHARAMARGRFGRAGYFGASMAGFVAPLAATHSAADFVAIGYGLVVTPIEEDREEMLSEARTLGLGSDAVALINRLSAATAKLILSGFAEGYAQLAEVRRELAAKPWAAKLHGEHSGDMLRSSDEELRRFGRVRFDSLEQIWDYDAAATLRKLNMPLLWVLAGEDREGPIEGTHKALTQLMKAGKPIDAYVFPNTDHGILEFVQNADGSRTYTRISEGYLRLVTDWINGKTVGPYGRAQRID